MTPDEKHLLIPRIENGVVVDHIPAGQGITVLETIRSFPGMESRIITLGLNYASGKLGTKDMIKVQDSDLPEKTIEQISLLCPGVTIKRISGYMVVKKHVLRAPAEINGLGRCKNPSCITNCERGATSRFQVVEVETGRYRCAFCERVMSVRDMDLFPRQHRGLAS